MIRKKICLLGAFAVGKTSLVRRFVKSIFSERYQTTVGVKIDKKEVTVEGQEVTLIIWDLHGEDEFQKVRNSYLRGSAGYLLVADGTRSATLDSVRVLQRRAREAIGDVPFLLLVNKSDLTSDWEVEDEALAALAEEGWTTIVTSAKSGEGVEEAFRQLAHKLVGGP